ncbi:MAG TPA: hypothetical protein VFN90_02120 [Gemmatimonadales bacterium]|nr:hypothetical protein [Gemmatimonadales bacterium]
MRDVFAGIVDYAGLFPPASLTMADAVARYAEYRQSPDAWMLGRFVLAGSRLAELAASRLDVDGVWPLSAVLGAHIPNEVAQVEAFLARESHRFAVEAIETRVTAPGQVLVLGEQVPAKWERYFEVPNEGSYSKLVQAIGEVGAFAKIRTGGTQAAQFPEPEQLTRFLIAITAHGVRFKATAGLHHPLRGEYPLTYAPDAERAMMYGFVNLLLATAELVRSGDGEVAQAILEEATPGAIAVAEDAITWRDTRYEAAELRAVRDAHFVGFGSCSFREPVDELAQEVG